MLSRTRCLRKNDNYLISLISLAPSWMSCISKKGLQAPETSAAASVSPKPMHGSTCFEAAKSLSIQWLIILTWSFKGQTPYPIGSMYGIYANIGGILMVNVPIYIIHGSYGYWLVVFNHLETYSLKEGNNPYIIWETNFWNHQTPYHVNPGVCEKPWFILHLPTFSLSRFLLHPVLNLY